MVGCTVLAGPAAGPINMGTNALIFGTARQSNIVAGAGNLIDLNGSLTVANTTNLLSLVQVGGTLFTEGIIANGQIDATALNGISEITFADESQQTTAYTGNDS
jgi:hypothetical protein